jgi:hypothetical protein
MSKIGGKIPNKEFKKMRKAYEDKHPKQTQSILFSKDVIQKEVIDQEGDYIRIYFGLDEEGRQTVMFRSEGAQTSARQLSEDLEADDAVDRGQLCPPYCS